MNSTSNFTFYSSITLLCSLVFQRPTKKKKELSGAIGTHRNRGCESGFAGIVFWGFRCQPESLNLLRLLGLREQMECCA
ncbi:hypothetical protein HanHA300_Chr15g0553221 [Helianthus annuus]|nr:hypothetical protein HanHA300_Chr15g0553221 [Helianthus annuus]KAJ0471942.1 hypothetical protein HanHA89_Chr15g0601561 [Helianthus annuus]